MDRDDRESGALIQAQKVEIDSLKVDLENLRLDTDKNRTVTRERPVMGRKPLKAEGKDSDHRFFKQDGVKYYSVKVDGKWVKMEVTDV